LKTSTPVFNSLRFLF